MFFTSTLQNKIRGWIGLISILHSLRSDEISFLSLPSFLCPFPAFFQISFNTTPRPTLSCSALSPSALGQTRKILQSNLIRRQICAALGAQHGRVSTATAHDGKDAQRCSEQQLPSLILQVCVSPTTTRNLQFLEAETRIELIQEPWLGVRHQL